MHSKTKFFFGYENKSCFGRDVYTHGICFEELKIVLFLMYVRSPNPQNSLLNVFDLIDFFSKVFTNVLMKKSLIDFEKFLWKQLVKREYHVKAKVR